ncbi:hypothetical protein LAJLEIBI_02986 [[Clostridium] hylemonae DSM 15053]|uniref:alcohol dehydrogenase catalytic domain-containing protein n=1 Tax=[Clostridium] hylemonae TaxID=89153 RepID=UPI0012532B1F|nr:hypothetical protein LAJLEIBI_02986 [[Clostridium] hylemonae DSM 15053]
MKKTDTFRHPASAATSFLERWLKRGGVKDVEIGDRVISEQIVPCNDCEYCRAEITGCAAKVMCMALKITHKEDLHNI